MYTIGLPNWNSFTKQVLAEKCSKQQDLDTLKKIDDELLLICGVVKFINLSQWSLLLGSMIMIGYII